VEIRGDFGPVHPSGIESLIESQEAGCTPESNCRADSMPEIGTRRRAPAPEFCFEEKES